MCQVSQNLSQTNHITLQEKWQARLREVQVKPLASSSVVSTLKLFEFD